MSRKADKSPPEQSPPDFEQALTQVQQIIDDIEAGQVSLEQSLDRYAQGMKLIQHCKQVLDRAEQRIARLTLDAQGNVVEAEGEVELSDADGPEEGED